MFGFRNIIDLGGSVEPDGLVAEEEDEGVKVEVEDVKIECFEEEEDAKDCLATGTCFTIYMPLLITIIRPSVRLSVRPYL